MNMRKRNADRARRQGAGRSSVAAIVTLLVTALVAGCGGASAPATPASATLPASPAALSGTAASRPAPSATQPRAPDYWPTAGWRTSTPEQQGVDSAQLVRALKHIEDADINVRSLTVIRNGYIVLEAVRQPFGATQSYPVFSVTKSVTGALIGMAIHDGSINSVHEPVLGYFQDRTIANRDATKAAITLEDLLTMQPGLNCADHDIGFVVENSKNWVQSILDMPMAAAPGEKFAYCTAGPHLLSAILTQATGMRTADYAQSRLFGPLGIAPGAVTWDADPQGVTIGGYGISMQTRDMAKLGLLYLYDGTWQDTEVVPRAWVTASTTVHSTERPGKSYGYLMWLYPEDRTPYVAAEGLGSQVIQVVKERNMVVVMTSAIADTQGLTARALLQDDLLPAAVSTAPLPANPTAVAALNAKVAALANPAKPVAALNDTARRITGQTFVLDTPNSLSVAEVSVVFAADQAEMQIHGVSTEGATAQLVVGVDNTYRQTPGDPAWRRGWWADDHTFIMREVDTGSIRKTETRFTFDGEEVQIHRAELTLGSYSEDLHGRLK